MTTTDLAKLVQEMREAQRAYFAKRLATDLHKSKALEKRVDDALTTILTTPAQGGLFGGG